MHAQSKSPSTRIFRNFLRLHHFSDQQSLSNRRDFWPKPKVRKTVLHRSSHLRGLEMGVVLLNNTGIAVADGLRNHL